MTPLRRIYLDAAGKPLPAARWLAAALLAAASLGAQAAESLGSLGSAFKPQASAPAPAARSTAPAGADGTTAADAEAHTAAGLRVVLIGGSRRLATVDGRVVKVGDRIHGQRVVRIDAQQVLLINEDGSRETLLLNPSAHQAKRSPAGAKDSSGARR